MGWNNLQMEHKNGAKKLAKKNCILKHNTSINLGENIYWTGDPGLTYDCVYSWGEEKKVL